MKDDVEDSIIAIRNKPALPPPDTVHWPTTTGTYLLMLRATQSIAVSVGRLGAFVLSPGVYVYIGSAHGPGGLAARLARHLRASRRPHWHIDALTAVLPIVAVGAHSSQERLECAWVQRLLAAGADAPIPGFGSSDCRAGCPAHLLRLPDEPEAASILASLGMTLHKRVAP